MPLEPCLHTVNSALRIVAESRAPCSDRNLLEILMNSFITQRTRSAGLFVSATTRS